MMDMPWPTLLAYAEAMGEQIKEQKTAAYVGGRQSLLDEYQRSIDEWRRRQPPPGGAQYG